MPVTQKFKRNSTRIALFIVGLHFAITVIYLLPGSWFSYRFNSVTSHYMVPLFHQNWQLFAPEPPKSNDRLLVRTIKADSSRSEWHEPAKLILDQHQRFRVLPAGKLYNVLEDVGRRLNGDHYRYYKYYRAKGHNEVAAAEKASSLLPRTETYKRACFLLGRSSERFPALNTEWIGVEWRYERTWVAHPETGEQRVETVELPPLEYINEQRCH